MAPSTQLTPQGARVIDPVLTNVARGYRNPMAVYPYLFPIVDVGQRGGTVIEFGAEDFVVRDLKRAPGADMPRLDIGYEGAPYACQQRGVEVPLPIEIMEDAMAVPGISLGSGAARKGRSIVDLQIEVEAARLAQRPGNYAAGHSTALAANARWDDEASKPSKTVQNAREQIRTGIGLDPNIMVVGPAVHDALVNNPDVIDRVKNVMAANAKDIDEALLARYFSVDKYVVGRCRTGEPGAFTPVWGKVAILAFSDVTPLAAMGSPSWGYTYRLAGYPISEQPYYEERARSWIYPHVSEDTPVVAGKPAGYLFTSVVG